jgi:hypothetical protein
MQAAEIESVVRASVSARGCALQRMPCDVNIGLVVTADLPNRFATAVFDYVSRSRVETVDHAYENLPRK